MDSGALSIAEIVTTGDKNGLRLLLASGTDVNQTNKGGQTPLILAIVSGHVRLLPLLLEAGANPLLRDRTGLNAIEWAERKGLFEVAKQLKKATTPEAASQQPKNNESGEEAMQEPMISSAAPEAANKDSISDAERSRRWIAGLKQRLDEKAGRLPTADDDQVASEQSPTLTASYSQETNPSSTDVGEFRSVHASAAEVGSVGKGLVSSTQVENSTEQATEPSLAAEASSAESKRQGSLRKRCPQCNTVYNSDLVAYCAFHVVPLVDIDAPVEPPQEVEGSNNLLLWLLVAVTFLAATLIGLFLFLPRGSQPEQSVSPSSTPTPLTIAQGKPVVDLRLKTRVIDLPAAQTALKVDKAETVIVRIKVDSTGRVSSVQSPAGNEELRRAAMEAARKATFSADKLRRQEVGTITYNFGPP